MSEPFIGEIRAYGFTFAPRNYALANGAMLSINQNTALFALLGTNFGGNGQTTFQLPNLGGRMAIGQGQSPGTSTYVVGQVGGNEHITILQNQMPLHTHVAATTVTPASTLAAATTLNAVTGVPPASRLQTPVGNIPTLPVVATGGAVNSYAAPGAGTAGAMAAGAATTTLTGGVTATAATTVQPAGGSVPVNVQAPYLAITYVIAIQGIFPSRN